MPPRSEKQRRAMHAAASGKSTIGIPKAVGQEFVGRPRTSAGRTNTANKMAPIVQTSQPSSNTQQLQQAMMEDMKRGSR